MKQKTGKGLSAFLAAVMLISAISGLALAFTTVKASPHYELRAMDEVTIDTRKAGLSECDEVIEESSYADDETVTIMIAFEDKPLLDNSGAILNHKSGVRSLTEKGEKLQSDLISKQNNIIKSIGASYNGGTEINVLYNYSLAFNGAAIEAPYGMLEQIKNTDGVVFAAVSPVYDVPTVEASGIDTQMASAGDMVGAESAWETGYNGEGMLVAVIDTGLYTDHEAFQTAPDKVKYDKADIQEILDKNNLQAETIVDGLNADMMYLREKIPIVFDYANKDCDVNHGRDTNSNDHGTHVAGIIAADSQINADLAGAENMQIKGTAPKAQLAVMKVFGDSGGGAQWANIVAAMEDSIYIGADSVNMSLGDVSSFPTMDDVYAHMFDLMHENGINVAVSAGNYYNSGTSATWNVGMHTTLNLENSMLTTPSIYRENLCVASVNNTRAQYTQYISVNGYQMVYCDSALSVGNRADLLFVEKFGGQTLDYVLIPGYGMPDDYTGIDVTGKIAIVERGGIIFPEKQLNAYNAGAAGMIVYDSVVQPALIEMSISDFLMPSICVRRLSGLKIVEEAVDGKGQIYVSDGSARIEEAGDGYEPSDFSSWGPLSDLTIKPEISAPGGNIISTVDINLGGGGASNYASYSGTSMASPSVAGSMALIRQRVNEIYTDLSPVEKADIVYALAMTTAVPTEYNGTPYGVRKQGAGVINAANAVSTNAYITVDGQNHPKIELGDDPDRSGEYKLSFNVVNFGDEALSYDISPVLTAPGYKYVDQGYRATYVQMPYNTNCTDMMTFTSNMPNNRVTVEAGQTVKVEVTITVNEEFRDLMNEVFKYGSYVEGYCYLNPVATEEGVLFPRLSVCYLGYYGSWCEVPVVDSGFYYDSSAEDLSSMSSPNTAGSKINTLSYMELGINPYIQSSDNADFLADRCSISPENDDSLYDAVDYFLTGVMRNLSLFYYRVYDPETGKVYYEKLYEGDFEKNDDRSGTGVLNPMGLAKSKMKAWRGEGQAEGQTLMIRCGGEGVGVEWDESMAPMGYWEIPVTVDNTPPQIVDYHFEGTVLNMTVTDAHYAAYVGAYDSETTETPFYEVAVCETERGAKTQVQIDLGNRETAYLVIGDYACNEIQYEVELTQGGDDPTDEPTETPTEVPTNEPIISGVYYQQAAQLVDGETYVIAATGDEYHALTSSAAVSGMEGAKTTVSVKEGVNVIAGYSTDTIEWEYSLGKLTNVNTGKQLTADNGKLTVVTNGSDWSYAGSSLSSGNYELTYSDVFMLSASGTATAIFRKVADIKDAQGFMNTTIRAEGNKLYADVTFKTDEPVASGLVTMGYDAEYLEYASLKNGEMLNGVLTQVNANTAGKVIVAYAGMSALEADGSIMMTFEFDLSPSVEGGTVLLFELLADETLLDDTTTVIKVDARGAEYVVPGGIEQPTEEPTERPTEQPTEPPTERPTEQPTEPPTERPTEQPTEPPTERPTEQPTEPPTERPTEQPTEPPTERPTEQPTEPPTEQPTEQPTEAPTNPPVPPETGSRIGMMSLCLAIFGISSLMYLSVKRKEAEE